MAAAAGVLCCLSVSSSLIDRLYSVPLHLGTELVRGFIVDVRHSVCSSSDSLVARLAVPDSDGMSLDCGLSAECADVLGVLGDFHLLDLLSEGGTVSKWREKSCQRSATIPVPFPVQSIARSGEIENCRRGEG